MVLNRYLLVCFFSMLIVSLMKAQSDCEQWSEDTRAYFNTTVTPLINAKEFTKVDSIFVPFLKDPNPCESTGPYYYTRYYYYLHFLFENLKLRDSTLNLIDEAMSDVATQDDYESQVLLRNMKGIFLMRLGSMDEMNRVYSEAIRIARAHLPPGNKYLISAMSNQGYYYSWMGFKKAGMRHYEQLYKDALSMDSSEFRPPLFRDISLSYADYLTSYGRYAEARKVINRIANKDSVLYVAPSHIDETVANYTALADSYFQEGDVNTALSIFENHLDSLLFTQETASSHSSYFLNISLGFHLKDTVRIARSLDFLRKGFTHRKIPPRQKFWMKLNHEQLKYAVHFGGGDMISKHLQTHLNNLWANAIMVHQVADGERVVYLRTLREYTQFLLGIPDHLLTRHQQKQIFEWHITLKNLGAETFLTYRSWLKELSEINPKLYQDYMDLKDKYSGAYYTRTGDSDSTEYYESKLSKLEEEAQVFLPGRFNNKLSTIRLDQLKSSLPNQSVFIDFTIASKTDTNQVSHFYKAFVVDPSRDGLVSIDLFQEQEIDGGMVTSLGVGGINPFTRSQLNRQYHNIIWEKLMPYIEGRSTLYVQADGLLNYLPTDALSPSGSASEMMFQVFDFRFPTDLRELSNEEKEWDKEKKMSKGLALGGILYDCTAIVEPGQLDSNLQRGLNTDSLQSELVYLPGTAAEVSTISHLAQSQDIEVEVLKGCEASVKSFIEKVQSKDLNFVHIATHGVYLPFDPVESDEKWIHRWSPGPHMSLRSLLFFADAANEEVADKTANWLNAQEISDMDLSHIELVVLSACETGAGDIVLDDNSFSMGRAFLKAGAKQVMVTLWSIPDDQALEFFKVYYKHLFITKTSPQKALAMTKRELSGQLLPSVLSAFKIIE